MPVSNPRELPENGGGRWPHTGFRSVRWGDMEVGFTVAPAVDCAIVCVGMPGGVCQCPHYGYVFTGRMRARYPGTDWPEESAGAGDVYFFPAGHIISYDEPSEVLELNPAAALEACMEHVEKVMAGTFAAPVQGMQRD
jgi:hypothetical protein